MKIQIDISIPAREFQKNLDAFERAITGKRLPSDQVYNSETAVILLTIYEELLRNGPLY